MSQFYYEKRKSMSNKHKIGEFRPEDEIIYHYDMGSTTGLIITFMRDKTTGRLR